MPTTQIPMPQHLLHEQVSCIPCSMISDMPEMPLVNGKTTNGGTLELTSVVATRLLSFFLELHLQATSTNTPSSTNEDQSP